MGFAQQKSRPIAVVAATHNNFVYLNYPNPISIAVAGYKSNQIIVKTNVGTIEKSDGSNYILSIDSSSETSLIITVFIKKSNGIFKLMGTSKFKIYPFPEPNLALNNIRDSGFVSYEELIKANNLFLYHKDFALNGIKYEVVSFTLLHSKESSTAFFKTTGNQLTKEMKESLLQAKNLDQILILNIKATGAKGLINLGSHLKLKVIKKEQK